MKRPRVKGMTVMAAVADDGGKPPVTAYAAGHNRGRDDARAILDLDGHSDMMQFAPGIMPDFKPATFIERADWLNGYAAGIAFVSLDARVNGRLLR